MSMFAERSLKRKRQMWGGEQNETHNANFVRIKTSQTENKLIEHFPVASQTQSVFHITEVKSLVYTEYDKG